jgi:hypothetical protein
MQPPEEAAVVPTLYSGPWMLSSDSPGSLKNGVPKSIMKVQKSQKR